jgi:hypothetical protein
MTVYFRHSTEPSADPGRRTDYGRSVVGIACSNHVGVIDVFLDRMLLFVR